MIVLVFVGEEFLPEWKDSFDDESNFKDWYKYNSHYYPEILIVRRLILNFYMLIVDG